MRERGYDAASSPSASSSRSRASASTAFPESHAASFALLVYVSAWLKRHEPAAFCAALLNSQPMGFYAPAQLVRDAREHGVEVRPVDVRAQRLGLHPGASGDEDKPALRLGLRLVQGLSQAGAERLVAARAEQPFSDVADLARRAGLARGDLQALAAADALACAGRSPAPGRLGRSPASRSNCRCWSRPGSRSNTTAAAAQRRPSRCWPTTPISA